MQTCLLQRLPRHSVSPQEAQGASPIQAAECPFISSSSCRIDGRNRKCSTRCYKCSMSTMPHSRHQIPPCFLLRHLMLRLLLFYLGQVVMSA